MSKMITIKTNVMATMAALAAENCLKAYERDKPLHVARIEKYVRDDEALRIGVWNSLAFWQRWMVAKPVTGGRWPAADAIYGNMRRDEESWKTELQLNDYLPTFTKIAEANKSASEKDSDSTMSIPVRDYTFIEHYATMEFDE